MPSNWTTAGSVSAPSLRNQDQFLKENKHLFNARRTWLITQNYSCSWARAGKSESRNEFMMAFGHYQQEILHWETV